MKAPSYFALSRERHAWPITVLGVWLVAYSALVLTVRDHGAPFPLIADVAYMPFRIVTTIMLWMAATRATDPAIGRGWLLLACGQAFAVAGNSTWVVSDLTGQQTSNIAYLAWTIPSNVLTLFGFGSMMRPRERRASRLGAWVDGSILVAACATIAWYFIAARLVTTAYDDTAGVFLFFFDSASNIAVALLAVTLWLRAPQGLAPRAMPYTVAGLLLLAAADLVIEAQFARGTYQAASLLDIWYGAAILLIALGAEAQYRDPDGARDPQPSTARADAVVFGALMASLLPLAVEVSTTNILTNTVAASGFGVVVLMLLVVWRQRLARSEIERLVAGRLRLEQQLWQAQKLDTIGRLAGGIAHDFNNILTAISAHARILRTEPGAAVTREAAEIQFATERAAVIVRRLLTFSGAAAPDRKPVVVGDVVSSMESMLRQIAASGAALSFAVDDTRAVVHLADGQLEQVLLNLVINARDATPPSGRISVTTRRVTVQARSSLDRKGVPPGAWAVIEVSDTGIGMDREAQSRLFEPFFTTKAESGGTGLGLATVAGIVHAADGHILVETAPGRGTTMSVYLPAAPIEPVSPATAKTPASEADGKRILVVDDELPIRSALARYLTRNGYRVIEAADVAQAYSLVEQNDWRVDLVLTDIRMPEATGVELAQRLRSRLPALPVLFMSGNAEVPARAAGVPRDDIIEKPFDLEVVVERVRSKLESAAR